MPQMMILETTIASGASESDTVDLESMLLVGLVMPAAWTAADITFLTAMHNYGPYYPVYDDEGNEVTILVDAGRAVGIDKAAVKLAAFRYIKLRSGTVGTPVAQGAARVIGIAIKG